MSSTVQDVVGDYPDAEAEQIYERAAAKRDHSHPWAEWYANTITDDRVDEQGTPVNPFGERDLAAGLLTLINTQLHVSGYPTAYPLKVFPDNWNHGEVNPPSREAVATFFAAEFRELGELMAELNFAPWKNEKVVDIERALDESADVLAFLGIILAFVLMSTGATVDDLAAAYKKKSMINLERVQGRATGYEDNAK